MSCSGHHFSVHSPDCRAHLNIKSNTPVQVTPVAPGSQTELLATTSAQSPIGRQQQVVARWSSPTDQHLQVLQPVSPRCQQHKQHQIDNDSDYTLVILDCSPTPNERALSSCHSTGEYCTNEQCEQQHNCQHHHLHHTTELILRQQHIDCQHHHSHLQDEQRHYQTVANQQQEQLIYGSGSIADRSASQTTTRSERENELFEQQQQQNQYLVGQQNFNRQPLKQIQETTTTTTTRTTETNNQHKLPTEQPWLINTQQRQHVDEQMFAQNPENYSPSQHTTIYKQTSPISASQSRSPNSNLVQTTVQTVVTTHEDDEDHREGELKKQPRASSREGTRLVKRWDWNRAEFVEQEVPDLPRPKPQPTLGVNEQQSRRDAWNEEIRQNITISPVVPQQHDISWLEYRVPDEQSVQADPLYRDLMAELQRLEDGVNAGTNIHEPIITPDQTYQKPVFGQHIQPNSIELDEHQMAEFICRLIPTSDPTMRVEWTLNGRPLLESSRITSEHDFGVVRLLIRHCETEDSGIYQCKAINSLGEAVSQAKLLVRGKGNVQYETLHPAGLDKIRQLENPKPINEVEEHSVAQPPKFLTHITDYVEKSEGESVHFECCLAPVDDPDMKTEWFFNGRPLVTGSRFHTIDDFGFIVLDIDWLFPRDTGEYVCRATNKYGTDVTRTVLRVRPDKNIILDSQLAENAHVTIDKLRQLEFPDVEPDEPRPDDPLTPAHFVLPLQTDNNRREYIEGDNCHFEARVGPATDGELTVEWFHNDKPLISGHRFKPRFDFGHILLDILYVYPEDSGIYKCLARNKHGEAISTFEINVMGKPSLIYQSQLPKEMVGGVKKIEEMEAAWNMPPADEEEEAPAERIAPQFVLEPKSCTAFEGSCARFCCRVLANPRARVTWFINGQAIVPGSRYKLTHDGMYHLTISKCQLSDAGTVRVVARNLLGECQSQPVELNIKRKVDDYRGVLKNSPNPWYDEPTLRIYRRQRNADDTDQDDQDEDFDEFFQNFKKQQLKLQLNQQATQMGATSPLVSDSLIGYMEPDTPDVNLLLASRSPLVEPGDLHPVVVEQQVVMAPAPSTVKQAIDTKNTIEMRQPQLVQHESRENVKKDQLQVDERTLQSEVENLTQQHRQQQLNQQSHQDQSQRVVYGLTSHPRQGPSIQTSAQTRQASRRIQASSPVPSIASTIGGGGQQEIEHGKELHLQTHKQYQVEHRPNQEILREIIERETFEQEHSNFSKESLTAVQNSALSTGQQQVQEQLRPGSSASMQEVYLEERMEPPEFTQKIQPCQAVDGDEAQFECSFKGDPLPIITWYCENKPIKPSNLYSIETDNERKRSKLTIRRVALNSGAIYTVKAENAAGSAKSSANLVIDPHPLPLSRGGHARQVDSSAASMTTTTLVSNTSTTSQSSSVGPYQYSDVRDSFLAGSDEFLASGRETPDSSISSNKVIKSVRTRRLSPDQMASHIRASPEGYVPPTFLQTMYDLSAKSGDLVRLDVRLIGSQPLEVRWLKDGERVRADQSHKLLLEGDLYTLLLLECKLSDEGYYECCALNQVGEARCGAQLKILAQQQHQITAASPASSGLFGLGPQKLISSSSTTTVTTNTSHNQQQQHQASLPKMHFGLTSKPRHQHQLTYTPSNQEINEQQQHIPLVPKLIKGLESQQVREGKSVTLRCQISAHPKAEISWFKQGDKPIKPSKYFRIFKDNDETHCLKILETFQEDQGEYKCVAQAQNGTLETSAIIEVLPNSPK